MLTLVTIPCLSDNYAFLLHDEASGETALIDAPEAAPIIAELRAREWSLSQIWLTHHHWDHVEGVGDLVKATGAKLVGAAADVHRLPKLDRTYADGDSFQFAGHDVHVMDVSGHTIGHIAFHVPDAGTVFTGDSLMALGCGRLFEGAPDQMWNSLTRLSALPSDTLICSGHEYTASNAAFATTIESNNKALKKRIDDITDLRAAGQPTVPSRLSDELETNPFLRAHLPEVKAALHMNAARDVEVFAEIRRRKDSF
ncbi:hydroxyacylglutathione hydrolase [Aliiroseovarius sp. F47248L]|uniref:hydroxyacylglutathione hydrolase n=1 Tax=Aliiroseovarius sp. F47248L TaxID=2926420 RepID=UPI001FF340E7|nr:hydroxyacylglutathione hydrolase [Aliiroseovarius sp. F47248L]MCK0139565.1 hydroxyacylglutathione hydrolase [Aliiroseovarius sp. F47248L]